MRGHPGSSHLNAESPRLSALRLSVEPLVREHLRVGRVVSTEFVNTGRRHQAMWFQEPGRRGGYYNFAGESLEPTSSMDQAACWTFILRRAICS